MNIASPEKCLMLAVEKCNVFAVSCWLSAGANPNCRGVFGDKALWKAYLQWFAGLTAEDGPAKEMALAQIAQVIRELKNFGASL